MGIPVPDGDGDGIEFFSPSGMGPGMGMDIEIGDGDGKHDLRNSPTHYHPLMVVPYGFTTPIAFLSTRMVSDMDIKNAMFSMGNEKSPGLDGFTAAFFKEAWDIVGNDVILAVHEFFVNGRLLKELNHTIIALILKVSTPARVNDFWPISCCNVLFKCISKVIVNQIKSCLKDLISPNQSAFVPGRSIADNILLTQEIMHNYHLNHGAPRCAFKVDIQKAYDMVDWEFLRTILTGFGFHNRMILTLIIRRRVQESDVFTYHSNCSKLDLVNLCFADDLFLFAYGNANSARVIMESLEEFKLVSGLTPSLPKSTTYFCNVTNHVKMSILQILPFEEGRLLVKYLGVPLVSSRLIYNDCKELIEKVQHRVDDWKNKSLSIAGRLQLVSSFIGSLHVFWASAFMLPTRILLDIEQIMRGFLWCQGKMHSGKERWLGRWCVFFLKMKEHGRTFKYPTLCSIPTPNLQFDSCDTIEWRNEDGLVKVFSAHEVWSSIRPRGVKVLRWIGVMWPWDAAGLNTMVWHHLKGLPGLPSASDSIDAIINDIKPFAARRTSRSIIAKLVVATTTYFIWQEHNGRLFKKSKRTVSQVIECIMNLVRLKLMSCRLKKTSSALVMAKDWNISESTLC
ncbi:putative RNA-directed DNA polymerase, eukaryota, reverse transcriptase zinc-binding domain protein [Tanacetum coccineum]